jgi:hypothetical protein
MLLNVDIEARDGYLFMHVVGQWRLSDIQELVTMIRLEAARRGYTHVLVDMLGVSGKPSEADRFAVGLAATSPPRGHLKVAILYPADLINKLAENTAVNRGAQLLVTSDGEAALIWLLDTP